MKITAIEPQARNPERVNIHVDGAFRLAIAAEIAYAVPLRVGEPVSEELIRELGERDLCWRARDAALNLLSYRPRTAAELRRRLREKGFPDPVVERCVGELTERRLVDDASFAQSYVRDRLRLRPRAPMALLQELRAKGVDWDTARATLDEVWQQEQVSETELARQLATRWTPRAGETALRARRRLYDFLARRGFSADVIREIVAERLP